MKVDLKKAVIEVRKIVKSDGVRIRVATVKGTPAQVKEGWRKLAGDPS